MNEYIIGLDIGGTKTVVVVGDFDANIYDKIVFPTEAEREFSYTFEKICKNVKATIEKFKKIKGISVSIGGPLNIEKGIIYSPPNLPNWKEIHLKELLEDKFSLPVYIEHDGNAGALAEFLFGNGRGYKNIIFITFGTGLGAGIILDGRIYRGTTDTAGEIGHIRLSTKGPFAYGKKGSWESFCSGPGLLRIADYLSPGKFKTTYYIVKSVKENDRDALKIVKKCAKYFGKGLAILIDVLNPEVIIIGSMAIRLGDIFLKTAIEEAKKESLPIPFSVCKITTPYIGEKLGDIASLCAFIYNVKHYKKLT
ncbi:MAG TPA: ROK family protein [bacterium]|nr:ROK family protein [bacterium]HPP30319.1 ROK family protein [bacterium]